MTSRIGYQVLIAVIAGIVTGLFLGPYTSVFRPLANAYIYLLQMVVLPYISLSIIHGLGSLTPSMAKDLLKKSWPIYLLLWGLMFFVIYLLAQLIPEPISSSINLAPHESLKETLTQNILTFLIPSNPLRDWLKNIVPAIAVFGVIVGIAIMHLEQKEPLLSLVEKGDRIIEKILDYLAYIAPIGAFAHIAVTTGTIQWSDLVKIDLYLAGFILAALFFTFWILPLILSNCTPMTFKESSEAIRSVALLPFVTGISTIAIPFINRYLRKLGEKHELPSIQGKRSTIQTIVPLSYSFAQIGNAFVFFFIIFASFYFRHPFSSGENALLGLLTIPLSIGSSATSLNSVLFLFNELKFPDNALELYTATMPLTVNFQVLISVAAVLTFILLVLFANDSKLKLECKKLIFSLGATVLVFTTAIFIIKPHVSIQDNYRNLYLSRKLTDVIKHPVDAKIYTSEKPPQRTLDPNEGVLERILRTGLLRVGYEIYDIPYAYLNGDNELVGFDIAMAYQLASDLNCQLELIPIHLDHIGDDLNQGNYDIAMSAVLMTEQRIEVMAFSNAYSDQNNVLLVPKEKKSKFATLETVQKNQKELIIGAMGGYKRAFIRNFPNAQMAEGDPSFEFGEGKGPADGWLWSQIPATVWCYSHPGFIIMDYGGQLGKSFLGYPMQINADAFTNFINNWIQLKRIDGFYDDQYNYWILGSPSKMKQKPRWSIMRTFFKGRMGGANKAPSAG